MNIPFFRQDPSLQAKQKPEQQLSYAMQQALHVLQLPILELAKWVREQVDQNPLLEYSEERGIDESKSEHEDIEMAFEEENSKGPFLEKDRSLEPRSEKEPLEQTLSSQPSLFEYLMSQAREAFDNDEELRQAESMIGNLDERGFLQEEGNHCDIILSRIQSFDPPGIAAKNLQDSLLIQLKMKRKENKLCYKVIKEHFDDLLHNRLKNISKSLGCSLSDLKVAMEKDIAPLDLHPGYSYQVEPIQPIVADLIFDKQENCWAIDVNEEPLPKFSLSSQYVDVLQKQDLDPEEKSQLQQYASSGKWLINVLTKRSRTLKKVSEALLKKQKAFFDGGTQVLVPLTMKEISEEVGLHESTVARAVSNKYLSSPQGIYAMKSFFTSSLQNTKGEKISNQTIKQVLERLIREEDKDFPLSDQFLAEKIHKMGLPCARRTVAKYRQGMKIPPASQRRRWH